MSVDREQVRRDDEPILADPYTRIAWWTQRCERIQAELEQAERERDEARRDSGAAKGLTLDLQDRAEKAEKEADDWRAAAEESQASESDLLQELEEAKQRYRQALEIARALEAQLVVVPALVEALRDIQWSWNGHCPECERTPMKSHDDSCRIGNALAKWEQAQGEKP